VYGKGQYQEGKKEDNFKREMMGIWKQEDEGLPNSIPIWYIQLEPVVLTTTTGLTSSIYI